MNTPAELVGYMFGHAKEIIESGKEVMPVIALLQKGGQLTFIGIPWRSPKEKAFAIQGIRHVLSVAQSVIAYGMVTEAWVSVVKDAGRETELKVMPRDDPKRQDTLMVTGFSRDGTSAFMMAEIKTLPDKQRRVMPPNQDGPFTDMVGRMVNFFQPETEVN